MLDVFLVIETERNRLGKMNGLKNWADYYPPCYPYASTFTFDLMLSPNCSRRTVILLSAFPFSVHKWWKPDLHCNLNNMHAKITVRRISWMCFARVVSQGNHFWGGNTVQYSVPLVGWHNTLKLEGFYQNRLCQVRGLKLWQNIELLYAAAVVGENVEQAF